MSMRIDKIIRGLLSIPYLLLLWIAELGERSGRVPIADTPSPLLAALLRHATYSFEPIGWDHEQLTMTEQELLSSEELEAIKKMAQELAE